MRPNARKATARRQPFSSKTPNKPQANPKPGRSAAASRLHKPGPSRSRRPAPQTRAKPQLQSSPKTSPRPQAARLRLGIYAPTSTLHLNPGSTSHADPESVLSRSFVQEKCTKCLFSMDARRHLPARKKRRRPDQVFWLPCKFEPAPSRPQPMLFRQSV